MGKGGIHRVKGSSVWKECVEVILTLSHRMRMSWAGIEKGQFQSEQVGKARRHEAMNMV